jgi:hypothetical protein
MNKTKRLTKTWEGKIFFWSFMILTLYLGLKGMLFLFLVDIFLFSLVTVVLASGMLLSFRIIKDENRNNPDTWKKQ